MRTGGPVLTGVCALGHSLSPAMRTGDPVLEGPCALVAAGTAHGPPETALPVRTARPCTLRTPFWRGYAHHAFPSWPAVCTGGLVSKGVCALVAAVGAHGPSETTSPMRTAPPRPPGSAHGPLRRTLQRARHTVGAGACGLRKSRAHAGPAHVPDSRMLVSRMPPEQNRCRSRMARRGALRSRESKSNNSDSRERGKWLGL